MYLEDYPTITIVGDFESMDIFKTKKELLRTTLSLTMSNMLITNLKKYPIVKFFHYHQSINFFVSLGTVADNKFWWPMPFSDTILQSVLV
jgi:hypothetical protein